MSFIKIDNKNLEELYVLNKEENIFLFKTFSKILHLVLKGFYKFWLTLKFNNLDLILIPKSKSWFFKLIEIYNKNNENNLKMEDLMKFLESNYIIFENTVDNLPSIIKRSRFNNHIDNLFILVGEYKEKDYNLLEIASKEKNIYSNLKFIYKDEWEIPEQYFQVAIYNKKDIITLEDYSKSINYKLPDETLNKYFEQIKKICESKVLLYPTEYKQRLETELNTLNELKNYSIYIYNIYKFIKIWEQRGLVFGPWKWSSVWSLILFLLWINKIDPVKNKLWFERFLNKNKKADIDIDIAWVDKEELESILNELFPNKVSRIFNDIEWSSLHPSWYIIADWVSDIKKILPLQTKNGVLISEWTESNREPILSQIWFLKYDLLNSSFLSQIKEYCNENKINIQELYNIDLSWKKEYTEMIENEESIFQMSWDSSKKIIQFFKPESFEDLKIFNAINRPAIFSQWIQFILSVLSQRKYIKYNNEKVDNILNKTYWLVLFQDQAIDIANIFSNIPYDILIKSFKWSDNKEIIDGYENKFIENCINEWIEEKKAKYLWKWVTSFEKYWLNESHAYSYAYLIFISLYVLYLKRKKSMSV